MSELNIVINTQGIDKVVKELNKLKTALMEVEEIVDNLKTKGVSLDINVELKNISKAKGNIGYKVK